jgi:DNA-binding NarL/FixJ family response regulator
LFDSEPDFELVSAALPDISVMQDIDLVLLGNRSGQNLFDVMASLKAARPDLRIIVTGAGMDEETILKAIASGSKGYVDEAASAAEFVQAIRIVGLGPSPRTLHVHRARQFFSGTNLPEWPSDFHRPRKRSSGNAGGRTFK